MSIQLSPKEVATLKAYLANPHLSAHEHASQLGISQATLKTRQERLTKKFGCKNFIGVGILAERKQHDGKA